MSSLHPKSHDVVDLESATSIPAAAGEEGENAQSAATEINGDKNKHHQKCESNCSDCSVEISSISDLHFGDKIIRDCRICHLSMDLSSHHDSGGIPIELGCSCKEDLAAAHKQCAEAWFKIKGNKTCEICGSIAQNVSGVAETDSVEQWNERSEADAASTTTTVAPSSDSRNFWHGHRFLNFLLACMVFAFVVSWLFHFNIPS
ncbi:uncharacterized protein LOC127243705 [Andrographis paniculata]|uniref:uncharacterized protein LOC127243705 n=1 Tax=Andrographis paniculata TaxID=175694 RepID=UPI0021E71C7C|nr:uncharacterized protein LOC127243705 [Andrographis paniculata]